MEADRTFKRLLCPVIGHRWHQKGENVLHRKMWFRCTRCDTWTWEYLRGTFHPGSAHTFKWPNRWDVRP